MPDRPLTCWAPFTGLLKTLRFSSLYRKTCRMATTHYGSKHRPPMGASQAAYSQQDWVGPMACVPQESKVAGVGASWDWRDSKEAGWMKRAIL